MPDRSGSLLATRRGKLLLLLCAVQFLDVVDSSIMAHTHRLEAVRAHLLEQAGDDSAAHQSYLRAARMTASLPEQRYLTLRAAQLHPPRRPGSQPN